MRCATRLALLPTLLLLFANTTQSRELAVAEADLIPVELASVGVEPLNGIPVALLREPETGAIVPIFIGPAEAQAILFALREVEMPRPMTHDLLANLLDATGAHLESVIVDQLRDNTYLGVLKLRRDGHDEPLLVDTRPSDGMALAARTRAPLFVAPAVLEAASQTPFEALRPDQQIATALGITVVRITPELSQALDLPDRPGVLVSAVEALTAARSGIRTGALILEVNGQPPHDPMEFLERISATPGDRNAILKYWQANEEHTTELPTALPDPPAGQRRRI